MKKFGTPLMKLFYVQNKTDKALELFMANVIATLKTTFMLMQIEYLIKILTIFFLLKEKNFFQTYIVFISLMNKLYEEKRYDEMIRVFDKYESSIFAKKEGEFANMENILDALYQLVCLSYLIRKIHKFN
jgi:hypothetical protein